MGDIAILPLIYIAALITTYSHSSTHNYKNSHFLALPSVPATFLSETKMLFDCNLLASVFISF